MQLLDPSDQQDSLSFLCLDRRRCAVSVPLQSSTLHSFVSITWLLADVALATIFPAANFYWLQWLSESHLSLRTECSQHLVGGTNFTYCWTMQIKSLQNTQVTEGPRRCRNDQFGFCRFVDKPASFEWKEFKWILERLGLGSVEIPVVKLSTTGTFLRKLCRDLSALARYAHMLPADRSRSRTFSKGQFVKKKKKSMHRPFKYERDKSIFTSI